MRVRFDVAVHTTTATADERAANQATDAITAGLNGYSPTCAFACMTDSSGLSRYLSAGMP